MELRILYAILSGLFAWFASFLTKISAEKNYNSFLYTWYSFLSAAFFAFIFYLFSWVYLDNFVFLLIIGLIMWIAYTMNIVSRVKSLKNISATLYFPIYKVISTIFVFIVWIYFYANVIKTNEIIWVVLWLFVPIILINEKENLKHKNMKKGLIMCTISIVFAVIVVTMSKIVNFYELNMFFYIFTWMLLWGVLSLLQYNNKHKINNNSINKIKRISILNWFSIVVWTIFFVKALSWNLWVVYTINSFSILIPIILSVIFYKDNLDIRKIIAIVLTILSMLFFKVF